MVRIRECIAHPSRMLPRYHQSAGEPYETVAGWGARAVVKLMESWRADSANEARPSTAIDENEHAELVRLITEHRVNDPDDAEELAHEIYQLLRPDGPGCWAEDEGTDAGQPQANSNLLQPLEHVAKLLSRAAEEAGRIEHHQALHTLADEVLAIHREQEAADV